MNVIKYNGKKYIDIRQQYLNDYIDNLIDLDQLDQYGLFALCSGCPIAKNFEVSRTPPCGYKNLSFRICSPTTVVINNRVGKTLVSGLLSKYIRIGMQCPPDFLHTRLLYFKDFGI